MIENTIYNLGRGYEFYIKIPPGQDKQGRDSNHNQERNTKQKES